jgi:hypothetical protein
MVGVSGADLTIGADLSNPDNHQCIPTEVLRMPLFFLDGPVPWKDVFDAPKGSRRRKWRLREGGMEVDIPRVF